MKKACLLALALCGCGGGPDFSGHYTGPLADSITCSDGSGGNTSVAATWDMAESGNTVTITNSGGCSPFTAMANGSTANLQQKTCPPSSGTSGTTTVTFTGGTLSISGNSLAVTINGNDAISLTGGGSATCSETLTGTLTR